MEALCRPCSTPACSMTICLLSGCHVAATPAASLELIADDVTPAMRRQGAIEPLLVAGVFALSMGVALCSVRPPANGRGCWQLAAGPVASRLSRV